MADWSDLDPMFDLPGDIGEPWRTLFEHLTARLRRETDHLPLNTLVQLQIERNLTLYVRIKQRESIPSGQPGGYATPESGRDDNRFWLALTAALNDQVFKMKAADKKAVQAEVMGEVKTVLAEFIKRLPDEHRARLRTELVELLEQARL